MANKDFIVEGRTFTSETDRKKAIHDQEIIKDLRKRIKGADLKELREIRSELEAGEYRFYTILGDDFCDELDEEIRKFTRKSSPKNSPVTKSNVNNKDNKNNKDNIAGNNKRYDDPDYTPISSIPKKRRPYRKFEEMSPEEQEIELYARKLLKRKELIQKIFTVASISIAVACLCLFVINSILDQKKQQSYDKLSEIRNNAIANNLNNINPETTTVDDFVIHYTEQGAIPEILPEFKDMMAVNSNIIGWLTIPDTKINYPVMQNGDNEYYLNHDMNQNYDRNGTIFMDKDCDVLKPSTNLILYGHHMQSGNMFGNLNYYQDESYFQKHRYITFDTIYEYGTYEVMYVFRSHVYEETEVTFKYYQFIDAYSEVEFDSYMNDMAAMSLYDTGVTAKYGDRLLTLSTCDYHEKDGRFVVVAKKIQ